MIGDKHINEWLDINPTTDASIFHALGNPQNTKKQQGLVKGAVAYKDKETGDSFLHKAFTTGNYLHLMSALYDPGTNMVNIDFLVIIHNMLNKLSMQDYRIINKTNNKGETPLDAVLNLKEGYDAQGIFPGLNAIKNNTSYIVKMLIYCGGYCKIDGVDKKRKKFLYDVLHDNISDGDMILPEPYLVNSDLIVKSRFEPIMRYVDISLLAVNLCFHEKNIIKLNLRRDLANLQVAVGYVKYHDTLNFVFWECMVKQVFSEHFDKYQDEGKEIYYVKPLSPLKEVAGYFTLLEDDPDAKSCADKQNTESTPQSTEKQSDGELSAEDLSEKQESKKQNERRSVIMLLKSATLLPRCFTRDHSYILSAFTFSVLNSDLCNENVKTLFFGEEYKKGMEKIIYLSIKNFNNPVLERLLSRVITYCANAIESASIEESVSMHDSIISLITKNGNINNFPEQSCNATKPDYDIIPAYLLGDIAKVLSEKRNDTKIYASNIGNEDAKSIISRAGELVYRLILVEKFGSKEGDTQEQGPSL